MFWNFSVGWRHDVNIRAVRYVTSWNLISHVCETRKFVMALCYMGNKVCYVIKTVSIHVSLRDCENWYDMYSPIWPWESKLLKTMSEKKKMLATSIFSFSQNVFVLLDREIIILTIFTLSSARTLNLETSIVLSFGIVLKIFTEHSLGLGLSTLSKMTIFLLFQTERVCRQQF